MDARTRCSGCGAVVPSSPGPTHRYIGASPGCWAIYGNVLTREYRELGRPPEHRLIVDAYAAQHPGRESLQAVRSVAIHLIALHLVLERETPLGQISLILRRYSKRPEFHWLTPPETMGDLTIVDVRGAREREAYARLCVVWARSVWDAWANHHEVVRSWASG